ncbi:MAG: hypothetical protein E3J82_00010 [Candidatus Thorarchaeota archaeon]|nr:MAG: hypothetical protein E3J82_00010 [Candidatus Thorarchaeota archaeon]
MRSDYILYVVAIACFFVASFTITQPGDTQLYSYAIAVLGIVFVGLGYISRPKETAISTVTPISTPSKSAELSPIEEKTPEAETSEKPVKKTTKKRTPTRKTAAKKKTTRRRRKKA